MKQFLPLCLAAGLLFAVTNNSLAGDQDFTLVNKTGVEIHNLHVSPADKDEWGEDILGQDTLADGESAEITFKAKEEAEKWDLKVADKSGNSIEWSDLNLLEISEVTLHYEDGKATAEVE
ncbi:MAG: argininosuccinate lyase [Chthoniobacterales bacterium]